MKLELLKRRAEMLDAVSTGLHPSAVVGQLAGKYGVSGEIVRKIKIEKFSGKKSVHNKLSILSKKAHELASADDIENLRSSKPN